MLATSVTFLPQFLGALPKARSPLRDQAYSAESETLAPISWTKTSLSASTSSATRARQAALRNSSRSPAPIDLFFGSIQGALASG
jgi:hypothetical protein